MIFQVDEEAANVLQQLCDLALKQGGMTNLGPVNQILASTKDLPKKETENQDDETD